MKTTLALATFALLSIPAAASLACSPTQCASGRVAPAPVAATSADGGTVSTDATVPAGVVALAVRPTFITPSMAEDVQLTKDGAAVATSLVADPAVPGNFLLVANTPLSAGTYTVTRRESCPTYVPATTPEVRTTSFTVGPAVAQPSGMGTLEISNHLAMVTAATSSGSCNAMFAGTVMSISIKPSLGLAGWAALTRYTLTVDGNEWSTSEYGQYVPTQVYAQNVRSALNVFARCDTSAQADDSGVKVGAHHAVLSAHVAGAASDPAPIAFDFTLSCDASQIADGGTVVDGRTDGGVLTDLPVATNDSGCNMSGATTGASFPLLLFSSCVVVVGCVRRRRAA